MTTIVEGRMMPPTRINIRIPAMRGEAVVKEPATTNDGPEENPK